MKRLAPIPTPPALRWREFRFRVVPGLVFLAMAGAALWMWDRFLVPTTLLGQVEAIRADVTSHQPGTIAQLRVSRFDVVRKGDPLVTLMTTDPRVLEASLGVIRADVELLRLSMDPLMARERDQLDFERLRLEWLGHRVQLATAKIQLQYAETELERVKQLFQASSTIASQAELDIAVRDQAAWKAEVTERTRLVTEVEQGLGRLRNADSAVTSDRSAETMRAAIAAQEQRLRLAEAQLSPIALAATLDGVVTAVYRRTGQSVTPGDPIVTITATQPERIVGYLRPPLSVEPRVGMEVQVRARSLGRTAGTARITDVNPEMEPLPPEFASPNGAPRTIELGLPIAVSLPPGLRLVPGELVDLRLLPQRN